MRPSPVSEPVDTQATDAVGTEKEHAEVTLENSTLDDSLFSGGRLRTKLTRSQIRSQKDQHRQALKAGALDLSSEELQKLQKEDPSLANLRTGTGKTETNFYHSEGLLFRQWIPRGRNAGPACATHTVLESSAAAGT